MLRIDKYRIAVAMLFTVPAAQASIGLFEHGSGIKSMGMGGLSYAVGEETTVLPTNPALLQGMGKRLDLGVDVLHPDANATIHDNPAAADQRSRTSGRHWYPVPQGGFALPLSPSLSYGLSVYAAGLGPDYRQNPFARFGGDPRASVSFAYMGVANALAWQLSEHHSLGASINLGYQSINIKGLGFLGSLSQTPDKVSDQGRDQAFGLGFSLGWRGQLLPTLAAGVGYRSKVWTQKFNDYRGLIPNGGQFDLPAIWGAGLAWTPVAPLMLGAEFQRFEFARESTFHNRIEQLTPSKPLGAKGSAGFGMNSINAYKLGVAWQASPSVQLRGGYLYSTQGNAQTQTLFGILAPITTTSVYSAGGSYTHGDWEFSGNGYYGPQTTVTGRNSIPAAFGGGEADLRFRNWGLGASIGRRFGH